MFLSGIAKTSLARGGLSAIFLIIAIGFIAAKIFLIARFPLQIHHDCALLLQQGQLILDGWVPYVDFVEVNLPLIMYLNTIPVALSRALGLNVLPTFSVLALLLVILSASSIYKSLRQFDQKNGTRSAIFVFSTYLGFMLLGIGNEFGQREHLFVSFCFPFILLRYLSWTGEEVSLLRAATIGVAAAVGVCLKPFFLIIALAPEIYWLLAFRRFKPFLATEFLFVVAAGMIYVAHFFFVPAEMINALLYVWAPEVALHYDAYANGIVAVIAKTYFIVPAIAVGIAILVSRYFGSEGRRLILGLAYATLTAAVVYVAQLKGWKYHAIPIGVGAATLASLLGSFSLAFARESDTTARSSIAIPYFSIVLGRVALAGVLVFCVFRVYSMDRFLHERSVPTELYKAVDRYTQPGDSVLFIDTGVAPAYPMIMQLGLVPASRYLVSAPVPLCYEVDKHHSRKEFQYHKLAEMSKLESTFLRDLFSDIEKRAPILIAIKSNEHPQACPREFRMLDYLKQYDYFSYIESHYTATEELNGFQLFVRR